MTIVATAGHVDHGKSTLVRALTGVDPDRWDEERRRGMTIDLGFASTSLASGRIVSFVDVPGHVRFLRNMLAGVGAVPACLFVVAATEGWKPQSEEHLRILDLLGLQDGLVALTKVAGTADLPVVVADVRRRLVGTFLADAPVVEVDAPAGIGVDDLRTGLDALLGRVAPAPDRERPRLWIDRVFSIKGSGTVVTGTLTHGSLAVDQTVAAGSMVARVRSLQVHHERVDHAAAGTRVAVNLAGVDRAELRRGDALVGVDRWALPSVVDASLDVLDGLDHAVSRRGAYLAYIGTGEYAVALRVLGPSAIEPGTSGLVRLHLPTPLPLMVGDAYVLREAGRAETVGGGRVLDLDPVTPAASARPTGLAAELVRTRGWLAADTFRRLTDAPPVGLSTVGPWLAAPEHVAAETARLRALVEAAGADGLERSALEPPLLALVDALPGVSVRAGRIVAAPPALEHPWLDALRAAPFTPPPPGGDTPPDVVRRLVRDGLVVGREGVWFAAEAIDRATDVVAGVFDAHPAGATASQLREALGTTRKFLLPLLAILDARGVTVRRADLRHPGPTLRR